MLLSPINQTCFSAIPLININPQKYNSLEAIKKIAEDRNLKVYINKKNSSKYFPNGDLYTIMTISPNKKFGIHNDTISHNVNPKELSVKIFNAFMDTLEQIRI